MTAAGARLHGAAAADDNVDRRACHGLSVGAAQAERDDVTTSQAMHARSGGSAGHPARRAPAIRAAWAPAKLALALVLLLGAGLPPASARADEELDYGLESQRLARIEITGNETFTDDQLKGLLRIQERTWRRPLHIPRYRPHLVDTQVRLLKNYYRNQGFHQVEAALDSIITLPDEGDVLHISIVEGARTYIRSVVFDGRGPVPEADLREVMGLLEGQPAPADLNAFGGDIYAIRDLYRNATYLDATVLPSMTIESYEDDSGYAADVIYHISHGIPYHVRSITLAGNASTEDHLLRRELRIAEGEPLVWSKVEESRRELLATSLFRDVVINPVSVDTTSGATDLQVRVVERKPAYYELGVGVGSLERVRLLAAWGHNNLWGTGRRVNVRTRGSWNLEDVVGRSVSFDQGQINYRIEAGYVNPRLRDSRYSLDLDVFVKRETRGESGLILGSYGANLGTTWRASRRVTNTAFLGYKVTDPEVHPLAPQEVFDGFAAADPGVTEVRSVNWAVYVDHRDDVFRPAGGMYTVATAQLAGGLLGGDYSFFKWSGSWHNYHRMPVGGVLALRFKVGGTRPYGGSLDRGPDGVPYDDRFFVGGASTVRGYRHNSLGPQITSDEERDRLDYSSDVLLPDNPARGGNYLLLTNVEWRFPLPLLRSWGLSSVLFFEGGNVWARLRDVQMRGFRLTSDPGDPDDPASTKAWDYRYSWGTGVRLDTPIGPVRVDVGFPLKRARYVSDTRDDQDPKSIWHFSLGYPF